MRAAAVFIDIGIVGIVYVDERNIGAKLLENIFIDYAGSTVGAVHANIEICEIGRAEIIYEVILVESDSFGV